MVEDYIEQSPIHTMFSRLCLRGFKWNMARNTPKIVVAIIEKAQKHIMAKSIVFSKDAHKVRDSHRGKCEGVTLAKKAKKVGRPLRPSRKSTFNHYTPFNVNSRDVLNQVEDKNILPRSPPMCVSFKNDKSKYYHFHHNYNHDTKDCFEFKEEINAPYT